VRLYYRFSSSPYAETGCPDDEVSEGVRLHLAHHLTPLRFNGDRADAEFAGDLLVQETRYDQRHHLALAVSTHDTNVQ